MNDDKAIFVKAVQSDCSLPEAIRQGAETVRGFERHICDQSYLDFLREQIELKVRGPEWTAILVARLAALSPYCGVSILNGIIHTSTGICFVDVDPGTGRVIRLEEHETRSDD